MEPWESPVRRRLRESLPVALHHHYRQSGLAARRDGRLSFPLARTLEHSPLTLAGT
jgi:hypothetical protein